MKIGIVTIYDAYNYGSFLQAYAMQEYLKNLGHDVKIIDYTKRKIYKKAVQILAKKIVKLKLKIKRYKAYSKGWKKLNITTNNKEKFDLVIIGSDEVWNVKNTSFEHWDQYFGYNINAKKIIAYAPSIGFTKEELLKDKKICEGIKNNISEVFARDMNTKKIVETIKKTNCEMVVDPTLLYLSKWKNEAKLIDINEKYILYYSYTDNSSMKEFIIRFAKENNLQIIVVGFDYKWCNKRIIATPYEFLYLVKNAEFVVTSTFHGTVFANIFKKKYIVKPSGQKVIDFLNQIKIDEKRTFKDNMNYDEFKKILTKKCNYDETFDILDKKIKCSEEIIDKIIKSV